MTLVEVHLIFQCLNLVTGVFEVNATNGDTHLGGDDFDLILIDWLAESFKKENGIDLKKDKQALQRLKEAAEKLNVNFQAVSLLILIYLLSLRIRVDQNIECSFDKSKTGTACGWTFE